MCQAVKGTIWSNAALLSGTLPIKGALSYSSCSASDLWKSLKSICVCRPSELFLLCSALHWPAFLARASFALRAMKARWLEGIFHLCWILAVNGIKLLSELDFLSKRRWTKLDKCCLRSFYFLALQPLDEWHVHWNRNRVTFLKSKDPFAQRKLSKLVDSSKRISVPQCLHLCCE